MLQEAIRPGTIFEYTDIILPSSLYEEYKNSDYYIRYVKQYEGTRLGSLHEELMRPFLESGVTPDLNALECRIATSGSPELEYAKRIVNCAYNLRYIDNGGEVVNVAQDRFDELSSTETIVVVQDVGGEEITLGTHRVIAGNDLEVFELFNMENREKWPHEKINGDVLVPGEVGRMGLHPIFGFLRSSKDKYWSNLAKFSQQHIVRAFWKLGMEKMREMGVDIPYIILAPKLLKFAQSAGIKPSLVEKAYPSESSLDYRRHYENYWKTQESTEQQPKVYIAPWEI